MCFYERLSMPVENESNICAIEDILKAEANADQLVAIIAVRISEGPKVFNKVMQDNLDIGIDYRYLLLSSGEVSLRNRFEEFQNTLRQIKPSCSTAIS